jgi:hypothetical protein
MLPFIYATFAIALTVPGFVLAVRALPWVARKVEEGVKPWACDVCSCFWSTALFALVAVPFVGDARALLCAGPAYTLALWILGRLEQPTSYPPPPGLADTLEPPR